MPTSKDDPDRRLRDVQTISTAELRGKLKAVVEDAAFRDKPRMIEHYGDPRAMVVPISIGERALELDALSKTKLTQQHLDKLIKQITDRGPIDLASVINMLIVIVDDRLNATNEEQANQDDVAKVRIEPQLT